MSDGDGPSPRIFISAGEASGDLHASRLARSLRAVAPGVRLSCLGGPHLESAGVPVVVDNRSISVVGASEVLSHVRDIYGSWRKIRSHLLENRPDLVVLIDFPDFNILLGKFAKKIGCRVLYYISPQIWAWREGRVHTIKKISDRIVVILPFEKEFYARHGVEVDYVGHPLVDILDSVPDAGACRKKYRDFDGPLVGLLPGSRRSEIKLLFDILMDSARIIHEAAPGCRFIIPVASSLDAGEIEARASGRGLPVRIVRDDTYGAMRACDFVITASGTVTLEGAILGVPMIIINRVSRLSGEIGRRLIHVKYIGLPNLIGGRDIAPEFVQERANAQLISDCAIGMLRDPQRLDAQRAAFERMREGLGEPGISDRAARLVLRTAEGR